MFLIFLCTDVSSIVYHVVCSSVTFNFKNFVWLLKLTFIPLFKYYKSFRTKVFFYFCEPAFKDNIDSCNNKKSNADI